MVDAVDKVGGVTGLVPSRRCEAELGWFVAFIHAPVGAGVCGTPLAPTLTQLTGPRGLAEAKPGVAPLS
jgi:hypothetical protein